MSDGLFRWSRNPMYLGLILALYGWWVQRRFIAREERLLEDRFGDAYRAYCLRVTRWV